MPPHAAMIKIEPSSTISDDEAAQKCMPPPEVEFSPLKSKRNIRRRLNQTKPEPISITSSLFNLHASMCADLNGGGVVDGENVHTRDSRGDSTDYSWPDVYIPEAWCKRVYAEINLMETESKKR